MPREAPVTSATRSARGRGIDALSSTRQRRQVYAVCAGLTARRQVYAVCAGLTARRQVYAVCAGLTARRQVYAVCAGLTARRQVYAVCAGLTAAQASLRNLRRLDCVARAGTHNPGI